MGRILAIDYGLKRCGIAQTDPLQIIANPLTTVLTKDLFSFLKEHIPSENVEELVLGYPLNLDGKPTDSTAAVDRFKANFQKQFPDITIKLIDERNTSKMAQEAIFAAGVKKMKRRDKGLIDKVSACIILQTYLQHI